jgi:hypothetical protein
MKESMKRIVQVEKENTKGFNINYNAGYKKRREIKNLK